LKSFSRERLEPAGSSNFDSVLIVINANAVAVQMKKISAEAATYVYREPRI
jgi:hypothetical protein